MTDEIMMRPMQEKWQKMHDEMVHKRRNLSKTLWGGLVLIWNTELNRDPLEYPRLTAWGITLGQKITWFLLYAYHCNWQPGKSVWRALFHLLGRRKALKNYEESIKSPDSFWR